MTSFDVAEGLTAYVLPAVIPLIIDKAAKLNVDRSDIESLYIIIFEWMLCDN